MPPNPGAVIKLPKLRKTNEETGVTWATIMLWGLARVGKTTAIKTLPEGETLIVACEPGKSKGMGSLMQKGFYVVKCDDWDTVAAVIMELKRVPGKCQYQGTELKYVVIDSLSYCGNLWLEKALSVLGWEEIGLPDKGSGKDGRRPYIYVAEKGNQAIRMLLDVEAHVVCICREGTVNGDPLSGGGYEQIPAPEFPGQQCAKELPGLLDACIRMKMINNERVFVTLPEGQVTSGIRVELPRRIPHMVRPNLFALISAMQGDVAAIEQLRFPTVAEAKAAKQAAAITPVQKG